MRYLIVALSLLVQSQAFTCPRDLTGKAQSRFTTLPMEESFFFDHTDAEGELTEEMFDSALKEVEDIYKPYLALAGIEFVVDKDWKSNYRNAHPGRDGDKWIIEMHGGFFRSMPFYHNKDMVSMVACHEVGHHLGGTNFYSGSYSWASGEGQSDYWSTLKCMRELWLDEDNQTWLDENRDNIAGKILEVCEDAWSSERDQALCVRISHAGHQLASNLKKSRKVTFKDKLVRTRSTYHPHPVPRCRLESFVQGAACEVSHTVATSNEDHTQGTCNKSTGHTKGLRPDCWYIAGTN